MVQQSLDDQIAAKMREIRRKRIYQRARALLKKFGREHVEELSCSMKTSAELVVPFNDQSLTIRSYSFGQFQENDKITIMFNGEVFSAIDIPLKDGYDPRRLMKIAGSTIAIERFESGSWISRLDTQKIKSLLRPKPKKSRKVEPPKLPRESDDEIAERFGL